MLESVVEVLLKLWMVSGYFLCNLVAITFSRLVPRS
jgi:hypothetical protein